ncbi:MAG: hypothetical protein OXF24_07915 [Hyphomicrobiales bacterium]|nr:hypothetical protein [Hyphomicrobiales bacterium]MCY4049497.1 hypothetical protein [Hyphomicrobiales bacterium]MCY4052465.1 hypothetical protein [Hyphomicrobiales bacterium]
MMMTTKTASWVSLLASGTITLSLFIYPYLFGRELSGAQHGLLALLLMVCSVGFVHGFGVRTRRFPANLLLNGVVIWTAMALLLAGLFWG